MSERLAVRLGVSLVALFCLSASLSLAAAPLAEPEPGVWQQVARFGGTAVRGAQAFTIGDAAYVVSGMTDNSIPHREVWRYAASDNTWTRMRDFPGTPVIEGVGFSIADVGYVCVGNTNVAPERRVQEVWQYDLLEDTWTRKAGFPGAGRSGCAAATAGAKAYVFGGYSDTYLGEMWEYDPAQDVWTRKSDCPGGGRFMPCAFAAGGKVYVCGGAGTDAVLGDLWAYDPASDTWARGTDFPGQPRAYAIGVAVADKGYVGLGVSQFVQPLPLARDVWQYDPETDAWLEFTGFAGQPRIMTAYFALGQDLYVGPGGNANSRNVGDVWRMRPAGAP